MKHRCERKIWKRLERCEKRYDAKRYEKIEDVRVPNERRLYFVL
jgi:hypothetical protein